MYFPYQGEIFSILCAFFWALAVILFRKSGYYVSPISLNLFKNTISLALLTLTMWIMNVKFWGASLNDTLILFLSGAIGIALADTIFFLSLNILGASLSAIIDCMYSPFTVIFAFLLIGERIDHWDYIGALLIVAAVLMTSESAKASGLARKELAKGIALGILSMAMMAFGIVIAKPVLDKTPVLWASTMRIIGGLAAIIVITFLRPSPRKIWSVFIPKSHWKTSVPASVMGAYFAFIMWIAGMKYTKASIAAILNQMSTIFVVIMAFFILKESLTRKKIIATLLAFAGALLVVLA